ncbi:MAG: hypothetical protein ACRCTQ_02090 [Brevinemataceae bacterium]
MQLPLLDSIRELYRNLADDNVDIHDTAANLSHMVDVGRKSSKLRIVTQLICILEVTADQYEYDEASAIIRVKSLIKQALKIIIDMASGTVEHKNGVSLLKKITCEARKFLVVKLGEIPFLYEPKLIDQFSLDISSDIRHIYELINKPFDNSDSQKIFETIKYFLNSIQKNISFLNVHQLLSLIDAMHKYTYKFYKNNKLQELKKEPDMLLALEFLEKRSMFLNQHSQDLYAIQNHLEEFVPNNLIKRLLSLSSEQETRVVKQGFSPMLLSEDEINALTDEHRDFESVVFGMTEKSEQSHDNDTQILQAITPIPSDVIVNHSKNHNLFNSKVIDPKEFQKFDLKQSESLLNSASYYDLSQNEDTFIKLAARLFLKQEQLKQMLSQEALVYANEDIQELNDLTQSLKTMLFSKYYISMEELLGNELREFIRTEAKFSDKKIKFAIRGEKNEILTRESMFIKEIVFALIKYSLNKSLESSSRRKALDKNEFGWLVVEFEYIGGFFEIYVRDDGNGLNSDINDLEEVRSKIENKNGKIIIDSLENEYLKIKVAIPMNKMLIHSLLVKQSDTYILLPSNCIQQVLAPQEIQFALKDKSCLGQVALSAVLGLERSPMCMFLLCRFGNEKIIFGVEKALYEIEALAEQTDIPLIDCANNVSLMQDGSIAFIMDERLLYKKSKQMIEKRMKVILSNSEI